MMNNNNNQIAYCNMQSFTSPYEVQNMPLGMSSFMPGFTPMIVNIPFNPNAPDMSMGQMQPMFLPMQQMPGNNFPMQMQQMGQAMPVNQMTSQSISPMFIPQTGPMIIPAMTMDPSLSPPMLSLSPSLPPVMVSSPANSVPPSVSQSKPPQSQNNYLGAALRGDRFSRSRTRSPSIASESDSGDIPVHCRGRSLSRESGMSDASGPSKRALVDSTLGWMESVFGDKYDNDGTRGENVLRLKVKTVIALEHIQAFIQRCHAEGLIESISCPVSTKKGRQHVRGYLAYIKGFSGASADRIEAIFEAFNRENNFPFKTLHRNPASTL